MRLEDLFFKSEGEEEWEEFEEEEEWEEEEEF